MLLPRDMQLGAQLSALQAIRAAVWRVAECHASSAAPQMREWCGLSLCRRAWMIASPANQVSEFGEECVDRIDG